MANKRWYFKHSKDLKRKPICEAVREKFGKNGYASLMYLIELIYENQESATFTLPRLKQELEFKKYEQLIEFIGFLHDVKFLRGSIQVLQRSYEGSTKVLLSLYEGPTKALRSFYVTFNYAELQDFENKVPVYINIEREIERDNSKNHITCLDDDELSYTASTSSQHLGSLRSQGTLYMELGNKNKEQLSSDDDFLDLD